MWQLNKIRLADTSLFKDVSFDVTPGLSVIYGLNQTSARTSGNGNAAGKSMFFSSPGEILYEEPIVGERQDANKKGTRTLDMHFGDRKVRARRKGNGLEILVGGKAKKFRTKPLARQWLARNMPITQEEYGTYVHIDSRIPHPLVMGTSTQRKKFFNSFFGLDRMDVERRLFQARLNDLGKTRAVYNELRSEFQRLKDQALTVEQVAELEAEIKAQQERLISLQDKNVKLQDIAQLLNFESTASAQIKQLRSMMEPIEVAAFAELMADTEKTARINKSKLSDARGYAEYQRDARVYEKALNGLSGDAKKLVAKLGTQGAQKRATARSRAFRDAKAELEDLQPKIDKLTAIIERDLSKDYDVPADANPWNEKALLSERKTLEHQVDHAEKFSEGQCDTCGQSVAIKSPKKLKARLREVEAMLDGIDALEAYKAGRLKQVAAKSDIAVLHKRQTELTVVIEQTRRYNAIRRELVELPIEPPAFTGQKLEEQVMQRMVDEDKAHLHLLRFLQPNIETIMAVEALTAKQRDSGSMAPRLRKAINDLQERVSKNTAKLEIAVERRASLKALGARLTKMKAELADEEPLKLLVAGHSDKEMKKMAVRLISSRLMAEVNKYAKLVFVEDYTFDFKWDTSQLSLLVYRRYGKRVEPSDVRKLSGAESKLFTIVLVLALLTFVPSHKRSNVMILDEPDSNFSPETSAAFKKLLPVLNKVIPSIIVITPKSDSRYPNAEEWTMVKQGGYGQLMRGHPSQHTKKVGK